MSRQVRLRPMGNAAEAEHPNVALVDMFQSPIIRHPEGFSGYCVP